MRSHGTLSKYNLTGNLILNDKIHMYAAFNAVLKEVYTQP